jgi:hypothetical protein
MGPDFTILLQQRENCNKRKEKVKTQKSKVKTATKNYKTFHCHSERSEESLELIIDEILRLNASE